MGREGNGFSGRFIFFSAFIILIFVGIVLAAHVVTNATGGTAFSFKEDNQTLTPYNIVNITINLTENPITANITQINITIPSTFTLVSFSNITSAGAHGFDNTSTRLSWWNFSVPVIVNHSYVANITYRSFSFNISASTPGVYNITVQTFNKTSFDFGFNYTTNLTVTINDTTVPATIAFVNPTRADFTNVSAKAISVNFTATDNGAITNITIILANGSNYAAINTSFSTSSPFFINFTTLGDGNYSINATIIDTYGNINRSVTRTFIVDNTAPSVTVTCTPNPVDRDETITCACSGTDATSGVSNTSNTVKPSTAETGKFTTSCDVTDYASNVGIGTFEYTVQRGSGGGGGGSGSNGGSGSDDSVDDTTSETVWEKTISQNDVELSVKGSVTETLAASERVELKISGENHSVGVVSLTATSAVIEIASTPQKSTFSVGETKKFEVTGDGYYDMSVTLKSIANDKAEIIIETLNEAMVVGTTNEGSSKTSSKYWILAVVAILLVVGAVVWFVKRRR